MFYEIWVFAPLRVFFCVLEHALAAPVLFYQKLQRFPPPYPKIVEQIEQNQKTQRNQQVTSDFLFYEVGFVLHTF